MLKFFIVLVLLVSVSFGCKMQWKYGESSNGCMIVDGQKREFRYFIPEHAKGVILPLIVGLHGGGGNPKRFEKYTRFSIISEKTASFIVVYPKGKNKHWNDGRKGLNENIDDVKFIESLINIVPRVDKTEIYVTGMSNGGIMTQRLACDIPNKISGIAVVASTMTNKLYNKCKTNKPIPALFVFGDKDTSFIKNGNIVSPLNQEKSRGRHIGIIKTINYWSKRNKCKKREDLGKKLNKHTASFGKFKDDGTKIRIYNYEGCEKRLRFYDVQGGGHRWPDESASNGFMIKKAMNVGSASHEINTADEIVDFFQLIKR